MVARVLRRLHDTTRELFVLVMREGVRDTTVQRREEGREEGRRKGEREKEKGNTSHTGRRVRTARVVDGFGG